MKRALLKKAFYAVAATLPLLPALERAVGAASLDLDPLVVTASRYAQPVSVVPAYVSVVSSSTLKATPAQTMDDALRALPGVQISLGSSRVVNPALQTVSMLGVGGTGRALVLLDGLPFTDAFTAFVPWSKIHPQVVERVEVLRGGNSNLYGSKAMSGIINVISRFPKERAVDVDASYGSRNTQHLNVYASEPVLGRFGLSVDANRYTTNGYQWLRATDRGPVDHNATAKNWAANVTAASLKGGAGGPLWFLRGSAFRDNRNHGLDQFFDSRDEMDLAAGARLPLGAAGEVRGNAFVGKHVLDSTNANTNATRTTQSIAVHNLLPSLDSGAGLQWSNSYETLGSSVVVGVDLRNTSARNEQAEYSTTGVYQRSVSSGATQTNIGVFGQWSFTPLPGLTVAPSGRVDYWQNHHAYQDEMNGTGHKALPYKSYAFFSPRLALRYQALEPLSLRGSVYRAFMTPTLQNLYRGARPQNQIQYPNPDLSPEILRIGGDFGWDLAMGPATLRATGFWNEISNSIGSVTLQTVPTRTTRVENVSSIQTRGATFEIPWKVSQPLSFTPSYTVFRSIITDNISSPQTVGSGKTQHHAAFTLVYDDPRIVTASLRGRYMSARWGDDLQTRYLDEHFVMDFSASRWVNKYLEVYGVLENMLNRQYSSTYLGSLPLLGEPFYAALGLRLHYR
ncbi:MAG: TonB-dependent receptor [Elusimicrobia bacterium]|nr:TonB-dependent receptor [Elusimicrobiota bacterium]